MDVRSGQLEWTYIETCTNTHLPTISTFGGKGGLGWELGWGMGFGILYYERVTARRERIGLKGAYLLNLAGWLSGYLCSKVIYNSILLYTFLLL